MAKSKPRKGGLKSSLLSLQSRINTQKKVSATKHARDVKELAVRRKIGGQTSTKRVEQGRQYHPIPFVSDWDNTLLIGEGNFSFALSLVQHHGIPGHRITATTYDTEELLSQKYPEANENLRLLRESGVTIMLHVDARALHKSKALLARSKQLGGFTRVVWNFPHAGAGIQDQDRNINTNQQLMLGFFRSVASFLSSKENGPRHNRPSDLSGEFDSDIEDSSAEQSDSGGRILVTLRDSVPYTLWEVSQLAKHPPPGHPVYRQVRSYAFEPEAYPGYEHRRTIGGYHSSINAESSQYPASGPACRTWEFTLQA
ncbi:hypothetical protein CALCODRAFT_525716 [Calocera cornea HHB12733]|uniref:25S rRNA (uridine-N(3))-methyltransferase BMT5-like domain-containing protein n=1 Tax=Calocera cornea HHB12733 TaxID=1353952 RepID=A0A165CQY4_9BASI|nr:hypothetical protein CALCODRAFT_525716 [Calocera cornea HHB12733]